ncbi:YceI family protein [Galbibacter sp. EGI 63066]|uniref:YceI family protein n=1 Tax=Galbibacter sp. EGI 63066 TaxID=2993559 RepID=UPI002248DB53|nr:YceI family protein [Galbibacter sp. EGI 63066]MCX2678688.1 YceI family protein [Galbibacter sp. EGI 63066]
MRLKLILLLFIVCFGSSLSAQEKYLTKQGYISFYSHTSVEDIKAENNQVLSIVDISTGGVAITILMKSFVFEKALMQEHFNENYVESDRFPKASFSGKIMNLEEIISGDNTIARIKGKLTIHGITKPVEIESKMIVEESEVTLQGKFKIYVADYNIKIPRIVRNNIAEEVEVSFNLKHQPYK